MTDCGELPALAGEKLDRSIKVSVIVPVLNDPEGVTKTLRALAEQDYPDGEFEVIVADNGSSDSTIDAAREFESEFPEGNFRIVVENEIAGSYAARNNAADIARGAILAFTDADCVPVRSWISQGVEGLERHDAEQLAGKIQIMPEGRCPNIWEFIDSCLFLKQELYVSHVGFGATANLFVVRHAFDLAGGFRLGLLSGGDREFGLRMRSHGFRIAYRGAALVYHPARNTGRAILKKVLRISRGKRELANLGLDVPKRPLFGIIAPSLPRSGEHNLKLPFIKYPAAIVAFNFFRFVGNFFG